MVDLNQISRIKSPQPSPCLNHHLHSPTTPLTNPPQTTFRTPKSIVRKSGFQSDARILGTPDYLAPELLLRKGRDHVKYTLVIDNEMLIPQVNSKGQGHNILWY